MTSCGSSTMARRILSIMRRLIPSFRTGKRMESIWQRSVAGAASAEVVATISVTKRRTRALGDKHSAHHHQPFEKRKAARLLAGKGACYWEKPDRTEGTVSACGAETRTGGNLRHSCPEKHRARFYARLGHRSTAAARRPRYRMKATGCLAPRSTPHDKCGKFVG